jgi:hypothetical protein
MHMRGTFVWPHVFVFKRKFLSKACQIEKCHVYKVGFVTNYFHCE